MTTTRAALLHAIRTRPAEDLPRLVYADHLEDAGESERAEFIRIQCKLAKTPERITHQRGREFSGFENIEIPNPQWLDLKDELSVLSRHPSNNLIVRIPGDEERNGPLFECVYVRGFIAELHGPLAALLEHGPAIVAEHPVERVRVTDREPMPSSTGDATWFYTALGIGGELIDRMCGQPPRMFAWFGSPAEAHAALNAAVLASVREKAGEIS